MYIREIMQKPDFKCNYCIGNVSLKCSFSRCKLIETCLYRLWFLIFVLTDMWGKNANLNHISEPMWGKVKFLIDMQAQVQFLLGELEFETANEL